MATKKPASPANLQSAINAKGYSWTAGPTALSELSASEQKSFLGLDVDKAELQAMSAAISAAEKVELSSFAAVAAPPAVDWRNNGGNWVTPIKNQAACGSCVSFGTCATLEARVRIVCKNAGLDIDLSEAHLFYCGCGNCCGTGWNFPLALNFAKTTGVGKEADFPYTPGNQPCKAGVTPYVKIDNWTAILSVADRKNILATKGPVVAGMAVFQDFFSYHSGVYRHVTGALAGYHCISVIGYDDSLQCWIAKNSWGPGWGDSGFFKIGYGQCQIDTSFAFYDVDLKCPGPGPDDCARYIPGLRRVLELARTNPALRLCLRYYVCGRLPRPANCPPAYIVLARAIIAILQRCPQYRAPFCRALG
ncbi:MAG TPA: C1 family peptidase [Pyrinomonadaceae bacterium]|nr:C1 family peptidase [Pyrinomonadaceae bacterium]